jgi:polar amino acid transport system substrate-binding protein
MQAREGALRPGRIGATLVASVVVSVVLAACGGSNSGGSTSTNLNSELPSSVKSAGQINILTSPVFAPISYYKQGSTAPTDIIGSDADILKAIAAELGVKANFEPTAFPGMIPGVQSGRGDLAGGGLTDTAQREQAVQFVDDFKVDELYVVLKGNKPGISNDYYSACGHKVAYTVGALSVTTVNTLQQMCTAKGKPITEVQTSDVNATLLAVRSGRAEVSFYDNLGFDAVNQAANNELQAFEITSYPAGCGCGGQYWGFAIAPSNTQLAKAVLDGLKAIIANGKYAAILKTYNVSSNALNEPGINLQTAKPLG